MKDEDGRFIQCRVVIHDVPVVIGNVYGPNKCSPSFFESKLRKMHEECSDIILVGDFNVVMDPTLDCTNLNRTTDAAVSQELKRVMKELYLEEAWRTIHPEQKCYSWYKVNKDKRRSITASRIDYGIVSKGLCNMIHNTMYLNGLCSDHSAFFLGLELKEINRGPSYWKLNTTYLQEPEYVQGINCKIDEVRSQMKNTDPIGVWEEIKRAIREHTKRYAKQRTSEQKIVISQLTEYVCDQEDRIVELNEDEQELLQKSKQELDEILIGRVHASMFRSKAKWFMEAEKCTRYFFSLEKSRYNAKSCAAVYDETGDLETEQSKVLDLQRRYYQELYTKDSKVLFKLEKQDGRGSYRRDGSS